MELKQYCVSKITSNGIAGAVDVTDRIQVEQSDGSVKYYYPIISKNEINSRGKIIRTLQVSNGFGDTIVQIVRVGSAGNIMFKTKFNLTSYNYLILWQGFIYMPPGMGLYCHTQIDNSISQSGVGVYVSAILQDNTTNTSDVIGS